MTMTTLVDNINEKFLVCKLCNEAYKKPKVLSCLHVFCCECLEDLFERQNNHGCRYKKPLSCTICRKKTEIPLSGIGKLPDSLLITNLAATIGRGRVQNLRNKLKCDICKKSKNAESKCLDCCKLLCNNCVKDHRQCRVTSSHCIFDLNKDSSSSINCSMHKEEVVKYFCESCSRCICIVCTFDKHKEHNVLDYKEALKGKNAELNTLSIQCKERMIRAKTQLDTIKQCEQQINEAESCIRYMAIESIAEIRQNERSLLKDLYNIYGKETADILKRSGKLKDTFEKMENDTKYNEQFFGTNELLIVQNDMKIHMNDVISGLDVDIPTEMSRKVKLVPVVIKPGELKEDFNEKKVILIDDNDNNIQELNRTIACQTDDVIVTRIDEIPIPRSRASNTIADVTNTSTNTTQMCTKNCASGYPIEGNHRCCQVKADVSASTKPVHVTLINAPTADATSQTDIITYKNKSTFVQTKKKKVPTATLR